MSGMTLKNLKKMTDRLKSIERYANYKMIGYEPKCKICNSEYQNQVEALKEDDYTLEEMKEFLLENGEEVSIMSLSRHFERHYPTRKAYLMGLDEEKARKIVKGERIIEQDLKYDPGFEKILNTEHTYYGHDKNGEFKSFTESGRDIYIFKRGYCITGDRFCELVKPLQRIAGSEVTDELEAEIFKINEGIVNDWGNEKKIKLLEKSIKCTSCQGFYNECMIHGILNLILNKEYGIEMEPEEFNKILFDNDFIYENVDAEIKKYAVDKND